MLRITLDIVPFGDETQVRTIGTIDVGLQQVTMGNLGQYHASVYAADGELTKTFDIHDHWRDTGAWELVRRAAEHMTNGKQ